MKKSVKINIINNQSQIKIQHQTTPSVTLIRCICCSNMKLNIVAMSSSSSCDIHWTNHSSHTKAQYCPLWAQETLKQQRFTSSLRLHPMEHLLTVPNSPNFINILTTLSIYKEKDYFFFFYQRVLVIVSLATRNQKNESNSQH